MPDIELYRTDSGKAMGFTMNKLAIIGDPVSHSHSPKIHNFISKRLGLDYRYEILETPPGKLEDNIKLLKSELEKLGAWREEITEAVEIEIKYRGYIEREREEAERMLRLENIRIRGKFNYNELDSLSTEARQKLTAINPETLAQASRIPGVSPSDVNVLLVLMRK